MLTKKSNLRKAGTILGIFFLLATLLPTISGCTSNPVDPQLARQAYYGSHLKPWEFSMEYLSGDQRQNLSRASAKVYNGLRASLGEENAFIQEIDNPDRNIYMMRLAAVKNDTARACLWAYEMHFVAEGENEWKETLSYDILRQEMKDLNLRVQDFNAILDLPYLDSDEAAANAQLEELLKPAELDFFRKLSKDYSVFVRPNL